MGQDYHHSIAALTCNNKNSRESLNCYLYEASNNEDTTTRISKFYKYTTLHEALGVHSRSFYHSAVSILILNHP